MKNDHKGQTGLNGPMRRIGAFLTNSFLVLVSRILVGGIFFLSGILKIIDPFSFADSIFSFQLLPQSAISLIALTLPVLECLTGLLLIGGMHLRTAVLSYILLMLLFFLVLFYAFFMGLSVDCGCFGGGLFPSSSIVAALWRDAGILMLSLPFLVREGKSWS